VRSTTRIAFAITLAAGALCGSAPPIWPIRWYRKCSQLLTMQSNPALSFGPREWDGVPPQRSLQVRMERQPGFRR
jgi:hypothetical protein